MIPLPRARATAVLLLLAAPGCKRDDGADRVPARERKLGAQRCSGLPAATNTVARVLQRPFDDQFPVANVFDHDYPTAGELHPYADGESELAYCGLELLGLTNGYPGYAFVMPEGTPVLAAADGEVTFAGAVPTFICPQDKRRIDDQLAVSVSHDTLAGIGYLTRVVHLSKVVVKQGDHVVAGQRLGLSGRSGCPNKPHLYFEVRRLTGTRTGEPTPVDPYGWDGPGADPWAQHERGAESLYLWKQGEAPTLRAK